MTEIAELEAFKNHQIKAKQIFFIKEISKVTCYEFVKRYHYLGTAKFFCVYGYGLYYRSKNEGDVCVGVSVFSNPNGALAMKGWFGLENSDQSVLELTRLCMLPTLNGTNATSFLLGGSMRMLRAHKIRAVITLADASRHIGSIYQVCNFKYYGLTDTKSDFYSEGGRSAVRSATHDLRGVWIPRSQKHRYCYLLDKSLKVLYEEQPHPTEKGEIKPSCCNGTRKVYDARFDTWYSCPICCGYMQRLGNDAEMPRVQVKSHKYEEKQLSLF